MGGSFWSSAVRYRAARFAEEDPRLAVCAARFVSANIMFIRLNRRVLTFLETGMAKRGRRFLGDVDARAGHYERSDRGLRDLVIILGLQKRAKLFKLGLKIGDPAALLGVLLTKIESRLLRCEARILSAHQLRLERERLILQAQAFGSYVFRADERREIVEVSSKFSDAVDDVHGGLQAEWSADDTRSGDRS